MEELSSELNRLCMDNEDPKLKVETKKYNFFRWRDGPVDQRSKSILPKLVKKVKKQSTLKKKMEEAFALGGEFSCFDRTMEMEGKSSFIYTAMDMEREFDSIDSEKMKFMKNSSNHNEKTIDNENMKLMENSTEKKNNCFSFNRIFILRLLLYPLICINSLRQVENLCYQDQLP
ncbi:hypothetical protein HAX54_010690 [Datura stramonium]|uniref:Uncharacterized protein n=1 Tax=Datura stramonium TaxID=4076 RepID=A0ABS8TJF2_DATST|nr:hypothetical protein [Datura stramonium]